MNSSRRHLLQAAGASALLASIQRQAFAQANLESATVVVGFSPGGVSDAVCRRVAAKLAPGYAKNALVDNRTGAGGQIAVTYVKGRPADGSTLLLTPSSILTIYPHIYKKLPYDGMVDLTPVSVGAVFEFGLAVGTAVPDSVRTAPEFLAWAKANPDRANFASGAAGSTPHFVGSLLGKQAGVELKHVAYRGTQPAILDLIGGNISAVSAPIGEFTPHVVAGKVRVLGISSTKRSRFAPNVPTFEEQGIKDMVHSECSAFFLPPNAPPEVVARASAAMKAALGSQEVIDGLGTFGLQASWSSPAELGELVKSEIAKWGPIVKQVGFTAEA